MAHAIKAAWKKLWWRPRSGCGDKGKIFNNNNSGKFVLPIHKFTWVIVIKNFAIIRPPQSLLGHHLWFHNFFHAAFFVWAAPFLKCGCFCVDFTSFCNLTNLCFAAGGWTAYWMTWLQMNCILGDLDLAELHTGWLCSSWTVYWVTWIWLNCILGDFALPELYNGLLGYGWTVYCSWVTWLWLNCIWGDFTLAELYNGWLESG